MRPDWETARNWARARGRKTRRAPKHIWRERAMDDTSEGIEVTGDRSGGETIAHASARA